MPNLYGPHHRRYPCKTAKELCRKGGCVSSADEVLMELGNVPQVSGQLAPHVWCYLVVTKTNTTDVRLTTPNQRTASPCDSKWKSSRATRSPAPSPSPSPSPFVPSVPECWCCFFRLICQTVRAFRQAMSACRLPYGPRLHSPY